MTTETDTTAAETTQLHLSSGNGPITRTILRTPLRDALASEIPIIDISSIFSPSLPERQSVAQRVRDAATNNGFFYISNHSVPASVTEECHEATLAFFRQDLKTKMEADTKKSVYFNGYKAPKTQRINPAEGIDVRESFSWGYDPRFDPSIEDVEGIPADARRYMRPEDFPWETTSHMPILKETIVRYFQSCLILARALTRTFALSLGLPEDTFDAKVKYPDTAFSANYYLPITPPTETSATQSVSIGSHTDFQLFTILWQDQNGGLEVLDRSGQWLRAKPIPGTMVVNIADYLQRITNDAYVSTVHRAVNRSGKERVSLPFFWGFGLHESCGVLDGCVKEGERKYEEIGCEEWVKRRAEAMMSVEE